MEKLDHLDDLNDVARHLRRSIVHMIGKAGSGHPGGSLSAVEIITYLFFKEMNIDPGHPNMPDRDRFVLSKGHAAPVLYAALNKRGYFPDEWLDGLRQVNAPLQGHPDMRKVPGVDISTGSLGTGFSAAVGMALAARLDQSDRYTYVLLGDGESQEGQIWEAAMAGSQFKLDHLIAFLDNNGLQIDGRCADVMATEPLDEKFAAFGWHVQVVDGHDFHAIHDAVQKAKKSTGKPQMIICRTIKGRGVSFMEDQCGWHGKAPNADETETAMKDIGGEGSYVRSSHKGCLR